MKQTLLIISVLATVATQTSAAVETTFQPNETLSGTTNSSISQNYGAVKNIYDTNSSPYVSSNDEISQAIDNLSVHSKQNEHKLSSLTKRLSYEKVTPTPSLDEMKKWAEQGSAEYQIKVGWIYYDGKDVRQDLVLARRMFQKAANQGDIYGQGMLGFFYENGLGGLRQNKATAKEWYGKVCDTGNRSGCNEYKRLNEIGY